MGHTVNIHMSNCKLHDDVYNLFNSHNYKTLSHWENLRTLGGGRWHETMNENIYSIKIKTV